MNKWKYSEPISESQRWDRKSQIAIVTFIRLHFISTNDLEKSFLSISQISHTARSQPYRRRCRRCCSQICCIVKVVLDGCWVGILHCQAVLTCYVWRHSTSAMWRQSLVLRVLVIEIYNYKLIYTPSVCFSC